MGFFTWIVVVVVAMVAYNLGRKRGFEDAGITDQSEPQHPAAPLKMRDDHQDDEIDQLRERVRVLERIAVDGRSAKSIADEIESLRDTK